MRREGKGKRKEVGYTILNNDNYMGKQGQLNSKKQGNKVGKIAEVYNSPTDI